jgi:enediyne biosynthesis protein E4
LLVAENQPLVLLHNEGIGAARAAARSHDHFLIFALEGTKSNRDGLGARVALTAAGRTQVAARCGGGSYLSASDHRLHFGLGSVEKVERVDVLWPSGERNSYTDLAVDRGYVLREGETAPQPLKGFGRGVAP